MKKTLAILALMTFIISPLSVGMVVADENGMGDPGTNFQNGLSQEEWEALMLQMNLSLPGNVNNNQGHDVSGGEGGSTPAIVITP